MKIVSGTVIASLLAGLVMMSDNFTYKEFVHSDTADKLGITNVPDSATILRGRILFNSVVQPIRDHWGPVIITSGFRNKQLNEAVGGVPDSQHTTGEAVDFVVPGHDHKKIAEWIVDNLEFDQLILEPSWIHISYSENNRNEVFTYTSFGFVKGLQ